MPNAKNDPSDPSRRRPGSTRSGRRGIDPCLPAWAVAALCLCAVEPLIAQPDLGSILPRGGQRGGEMSIFLHGKRLGDVQEILFYGPGITVRQLKAHDDGKVEAVVAIDAACRLGEHRLRARAAAGVSRLRTFWVGQFPTVDEKEPNGDFASPQPIEIPATVHGSIGNEDVDHYVVEAKKGQRLAAEIEAMRLAGSMFDPYVAILDAKRFELAASDDSALLLQDSVASIVVPEDGRYIIQVRESSYAGGDRYRLHVGAFPRPLAVYPPGAKPGQTLEVTFLGDPAGPFAQQVEVPASAAGFFPVFARRDDLSAPSPNFLRVTGFDELAETEPNDDAEHATATEQVVPLALAGLLQKPGDVDWFRFKATAGQHLQVRLHGRSLRSPLDGVVSVHAADGRQLAINDDADGPDSDLRFKFPADGDFLVQVRDHLGKGGPTYVYRVELAPIASSLSVHIPRFGRDSQARQTINVPRGNRTATLLTVARQNADGDLVYEAPDLPEGVVMHAERLPSSLRQQPVVFEAAPDAPIGGRLVDLRVRHEDRDLTGPFLQTIDLVIGAPNRTVYYRQQVGRAAVAVVEPAPFHLELAAPKVPLVQRGIMNLRVRAVRREGFEDPITVRLLWKPPGVNGKNTVQIGQGATEVDYPINAAGNASTQTWKIVMLGEAAGQRVASAPTPLTVAPPYVGMSIEMTAAEQGEIAQVLCRLEQNHAFDGEAEVTLLGLPAHATTGSQTITKEDQELLFDVETGPQTPPGKHQNLFCRLRVMQAGEPIVHNLGHGGVLRIDRPPPAPKAEPKPAKAKPKPKPKPKAEAPPPRRLTRLERLRLEATQRMEAAP